MDLKNKVTLGLIGTVMYLLVSVWLLMPLVKFYQLAISLNQNVNSKADFSPIKQMYLNPLLDFKSLQDPTMFKGYLVALMLLTLAIVFLIVAAKNSAINDEGVKYLKDNGTHGTANWMTEGEAKKVLGIGTNEGLILGKINGRTVTLPKKTYFNRNVAVFGAPGSMKSRSYVRTNILQLAKEGQSIIVTDPKGELFNDMAQFLRDMGYNVKIFNLVSMIHSDRWNPVDVIQDDIDAQTFAEVVISNTKIAGSKSGDPFWDRAEQNLLKALVLYVATEYSGRERNLASVYSLLASSDPKQIDMIFKGLPNGHPAKMPYNIYAQANDTVRTGVVIGLGTRLQVFQNRLVQRLTEESDIDLELPGKDKCAYFCVSSDMDSTFDFLAGLFFSFLFIKLIRYADMNGGHCDPNVYFLLDEFPNIGAIPDFTKKISTMRSRGIHSSVIFQNIAQLKNRYPNDAWQEIIGNCDTRLFLGCTDTATAEFVSALLGQATVQSQSIRKKAGFEGMFDFGDVSISTQKRALLNPDEILRLEPMSALLILRGQKPFKVEKMDYTKHPLSKQIKPIPISEYNPEWVQQEGGDYSPVWDIRVKERLLKSKEKPDKKSKTEPDIKREKETDPEQLTFYISNEPIAKEVKEPDEIVKETNIEPETNHETEPKQKPKRKKKSVW
ncbi:VirD4-like conjugal transfer protein, CD1115 family [Thermoanaerobacterium butyriciformans]|uniref:Type IV secretion system protein VirD4 n=1 Tax=Thermoanaerobacterium butyriciformans TaxID=1702242 RepID=A0ABS4NAU2_9THEO|nr:type IV secretory system conjugative DNA transfer family protein [Thermoanaerobacterium butyriciformans]MBP2070782.1 type IV secretion system protein VirD4 [Thermoanaerobacterium butyriciformans]